MPARTYAVQITLTYPPANPAAVKRDLDEMLKHPMILVIARASGLVQPRFLLQEPTATEATLWAYFDAGGLPEAVASKKKVIELMANPLVSTQVQSKIRGGKIAVSPNAPQLTA